MKPLSSLTCEHSPISLNNTEDLQTWVAEVCRASPSQLPENNLPAPMIETCGQQLSTSFAQLSQNIACSKMYPDCLEPEKKHNVWMTAQQDIFGTFTPFSETWPKQGIMLDGVCWEQMIVEHGTIGKGSGYMPTPNTMDVLPCRSFEAMKKQATTGGRKNRSAPGNLREWINPEMHRAYKEASDEVNNFPTPSAQMAGAGDFLDSLTGKDGAKLQPGERAYNPKTGNHTQITLNRHVKTWPTPAARDYKGGKKLDTLKKAGRGENNSLPDKVNTLNGDTGALNPDWVEWLMGWPIGWTSLEPLKSDEILNPSIEPDIPRVTKKTKDRAARLKAIGNGQFSLCVVKAWQLLTK